ncbi:phosphotransferase [Agromyces allii]|uniref:Aminoglycoside phosphotransferase domain-containing protein n=1 Tax=Agromyces allii TaxID=393607 RepID=A0ABP5BGZ4_9MICO|nr:phosphotransferase [Agromyces allii]
MDQRRTPFSVEVASEPWRAEAREWISNVLEPLGRQVTRVDQTRVRPWSTQLVVSAESPAGPTRYWFKATCPAQSFEPALQALLADALPESVAAPVAVDAGRGWMLTADHGSTLREVRGDAGPTADDWFAVTAEWTRMQDALVGLGPEITALGVPDCSPATVPDRFELMLARVLGLPTGHPSAPDAETAAALEAAWPHVADATGILLASGLPATLQHGDLHPGNVFAAAAGEHGNLRVFDFGDAQWAHPVEALLIPAAVMEYGSLDAAPMLDAARRAWSDIAPLDVDEWTELTAAAEATQAVNRATTWWDCLEDATDDEVVEWGEAPLRHLSRVLGRDEPD